ncbi:AMP-binding protein, partial [Burkholderia multivorans]
GVAALVPTSASAAYVETIAEQVEQFARTRSTSTNASEGGVLALPTSGSTGAPKLVALPVTGLAHFLNWGSEYFGFQDAMVSLSLSPWNFDVSLLDTWAVLVAAGTVVAAEAARLHDAAYLTRMLDEYRP